MKRLTGRIEALRFHLANWIRPKHLMVNNMTLHDWLVYHQKKIVFDQVSWMGISTLKNVLDLWIYQEIIWEVQPDLIIEIGSFNGGSTLYFAHILDIVGKGQVISIDIDRSSYQVSHPRIIPLTGSSQSESIISEVAGLTQGRTVLLNHDGDHRKESVLKDMDVYSKFVTVGSYLIVEDGIVDIMESEFAWGQQEGPMVAVEEFLSKNHHFKIDANRERYLLTYNPKGYLKRIS